MARAMTNGKSAISLRSVVSLICGIAVLGSAGCGTRPSDQPSLGRVTGLVTFDGQPLPGVEVTFAPMKGRSSGGITDGKGRYTLTYVGATNGAKVGKHSVFIAWPVEESPDDGASPQLKKDRPRIPARYNKKSTLSADVKSGGNTIDFALESK